MNFSSIGKNLSKREVAIPVAYFAGAAGYLAYGTYALVSHIRNERKTTVGAVTKLSLPAVLSTGMVLLGVRDLKAGTPLIEEAYDKVGEMISSPRGRPRVRSAATGRGRSRTRRSSSSK